MATAVPEEIQEKMDKAKKDMDSLVRIYSTDIKGYRNVYAGLTRIKGVSFSLSNAICKILKIDRRKKVAELSKDEIETITKEIKNPRVPRFFLNRRNDIDTGEDRHLSVTDLDLRKEFDLKRLQKIKSYRGIRHSRGLPVRGQRTRSHFRKKGRNKAIGVKTKKK